MSELGEFEKEIRKDYEYLENKLVTMYDKVFDGFPKEIRREVKEAMGEIHKEVVSLFEIEANRRREDVRLISNRLWAFIAALTVALAGIIVGGRLETGTVTAAAEKNYREIEVIKTKLDMHLLQTGQLKFGEPEVPKR